jgi:glucose-6-phosphate isomerase
MRMTKDVTAAAPEQRMCWMEGTLAGGGTQRTRKTLADLRGLFLRGETCGAPATTELYCVEWTGTAAAGAAGGLLFGSTTLHAGDVEGEYYMTHGHFHRDRTCDELYFTAAGEGILLRMAEDGRTWAETMLPGTVHAIRGIHAHRVVNTGAAPLVFWASWPADAGYEYEAVRRQGFGLRVFKGEGAALLLERGVWEGRA